VQFQSLIKSNQLRIPGSRWRRLPPASGVDDGANIKITLPIK
jgi:hypothetical protein